jgi:hypothetical protein
VPAFGGDSFNHSVDDATVTIPFTLDGSSTIVRVWAGVDAQATLIGAGGGYATVMAEALITELCLTTDS